MAPQQDPETTNEPELKSPTQDLPMPEPTPELAGVVDPVADVDSNGFVPEHTNDDDIVLPVDEHEPFQSQLAPVNSPKKSKKRLFIIIASAVAVVLLGGASAFAFYYNAPDKAVADAFGQMLTASSLKSQGSLAVDSTDKADADMKLSYVLAANKTSFSTDADLGVVVDGKTTAIKGSMVATKDTMAIKMTNFRDLLKTLMGVSSADESYLDMFSGLIAKIDNKWVVLTKDDLNQFSNDEEADTQTTCAQNALTTFQTDKTQQNEVMKVYSENRFIVVSKSLGNETINGKLSNRYELTIDDAKVKTFGDKMTSTAVFKAVDKCYEGELTNQYKASTKESTEKDAKVTSKFEFWVDMISHTPTKLKITTSDKETALSFESFIQLNASPKIEVPKADTTLKDLQTEVENIQQDMYGDLEMEDSTSVLGIRTFI